MITFNGLYSLYLKSAIQILTNLSRLAFPNHHISFLRKSRQGYFYSNTPHLPDFIRKHVFNFRPWDVVLFIRMSIYECEGKMGACKLFLFSGQQYLAYQNV